MSDQYWLSEAQLERIKPYFPRFHGRPRVDDSRVSSGIVHVIRKGLRWRDAPEVYGPHETLYNRFMRWSRIGVFCRILFGRLKDWRRIAVRYDRSAHTFFSAICVAATIIFWL